jgi:Subtilase family
MKKRLAVLAVTLGVMLLPALRIAAQSTPNPVPAQTEIQEYILTTAPANLFTVCANHGLTIISTINSNTQQVQVLVAGSSLVDPAGLLLEVQADPLVLHFSFQRTVVSSAVQNQLPSTVTTGVSTAATNYASVPLSTTAYFYGQYVWQPYATQTAPLMLNPASLNNPHIQNQNNGPNTYTYGQLPGGNNVPTPLCQQLATGAVNGGGNSQNMGLGIVAIIDTGVDANNPVLKPCLVSGYDFTTNTPGIPDEMQDPMLDQSTAAILNQSTAHILNGQSALLLNQSTAAILNHSTAHILNGENLPADFGHGTMIAGLVHLIAPGARIMPLKAFAEDGTAQTSNIVAAIYYAVDNGASVINMSFGESDISTEVMQAVNYATRNNVVCVASTGNAGTQTIVYPASYGNVLGVTSVNAQGYLSTFSNYGPAITAVAAPGENLVTTYPGGNYAAVSGTSFSAALITGGVSELLVPQQGLPGNAPVVPQALNPFYVLASFASAGFPNHQIGGYGVVDLVTAAKAAQQYVHH